MWLEINNCLTDNHLVQHVYTPTDQTWEGLDVERRQVLQTNRLPRLTSVQNRPVETSPIRRPVPGQVQGRLERLGRNPESWTGGWSNWAASTSGIFVVHLWYDFI